MTSVFSSVAYDRISPVRIPPSLLSGTALTPRLPILIIHTFFKIDQIDVLLNPLGSPTHPSSQPGTHCPYLLSPLDTLNILLDSLAPATRPPGPLGTCYTPPGPRAKCPITPKYSERQIFWSIFVKSFSHKKKHIFSVKDKKI